MCLICIELEKDKLTSLEARRNLGEMSEQIVKDHKLEVLKLIWQKEDEEYIRWYKNAKYGDEEYIHWYEDAKYGDTD